MKWFKRKTKFYEEVHYPHIQPLPHQRELITKVMSLVNGSMRSWGRMSGKTSTKVFLASALLEGTDYYIVRDVK